MPLTNEELLQIREILDREPTNAELYMFEAQWSEHCSYKSSRYYLRLLPNVDENVIIGPGRDAPAVRIFNNYAVVFKIESHNHPSAIDPYNGAATGVGGIVRDILTLGAKPIALLDMLFLGEPLDPQANWLIKNVVKGISDYGNRIGVPVVSGMTWFDKTYNRYPLVNVACVGIVEVSKLVNKVPEANDLILIIGNTTGRDGVLGSSFASKSLDSQEDYLNNISAIQVGNPLVEKLIIDFITDVTDLGLVKYIKDLGGGGLATAVSELTADHNLGATIVLDHIHVREPDISPEEILVSESQERMLVVVNRANLEELKKVLDKYGVQYSIVGSLDGDGVIKVYHKGNLIAAVPAKELARPHIKMRKVEIPKYFNEVNVEVRIAEIPEVKDLHRLILKMLTSPTIASKEWIYSQYDYEVGIRTVIKPGYGDAAVLRLVEVDEGVGIAIKGDGNPRYTYVNPFRGAANAVAECYRNLVSVGSKPIAIVDEVNAGNPEKPHHYWYFTEIIKGISWITQELKLPVVGGKVSFYNEDLSSYTPVKPVATIVGVGTVNNLRYVTTLDLKNDDDLIIAVGTTYPEVGATEFLNIYLGLEIGDVPLPRPSSELRNAAFVSKLISLGYAKAVHDIDVGGLAVAIAEMCIKGLKGAVLDLSKLPARGCSRYEELLFSETQARYLIEVSSTGIDAVVDLAKEYGVEIGFIGKVLGNELVINWGELTLTRFNIDELVDAYEYSLQKLMS